MLYLPLHLIQPALGQKVEAKPGRSTLRERCQRRPAMDCDEEASLPGPMGSRLSRVGGRASPLQAKSVSPPAQEGVLDAAHAVGCGQTSAVRHAITQDTRSVHSTDEVPRRRVAPRPVTASYKLNTKGKPHAPVPGTRSHWPRLQGCQQIQSSPASGRDERCNRNRLDGMGFDMEKVSIAAAATKWPARTSSWQPVFQLRNISQHETHHRRANAVR